MPRNQAHALLLTEGFPMVPRTRPGDTQFGRSHCNKQTKQTSFLDGGIVFIFSCIIHDPSSLNSYGYNLKKVDSSNKNLEFLFNFEQINSKKLKQILGYLRIISEDSKSKNLVKEDAKIIIFFTLSVNNL